MSESKKESEDLLHNASDNQIHLYKRRWAIIIIFAIYLSTNSYQWLSLVIIGDVIQTFYNESLPEDEFERDLAVDWLSLVYMATYILLIVPSMWFLQVKGLRVSALCGAFLNAAGAWIKVVSVSPDRFSVLMVGQTVCAVAQVFTLSLPTRIAAVWFGQHEVSTATSIGVLGIQTGLAAGFLLPPVIVPHSSTTTEISQNLSYMFYIGAGVTTFCLLLTIIVSREKPPIPPSLAEQKAIEHATGNVHYKTSLLRLVKNRDFCLVCLSFAIIIGCSYAISTLLNPIILFYFKDHQQDAGAIGLTIIVSGVVGSLASGLWLDKTKMFKATTVGIYLLSCVGMLVYTFILKLNQLALVYLCAGFFGFFMTGFRPVGFQLAAEVTFPESEGLSSGLINGATEIVGVVFTIGMRTLMTKVSILVANITVSLALFMGIILSALIRPNYLRQQAEKEVISRIEMEINIDDENIQKNESRA